MIPWHKTVEEGIDHFLDPTKEDAMELCEDADGNLEESPTRNGRGSHEKSRQSYTLNRQQLPTVGSSFAQYMV